MRVTIDSNEPLDKVIKVLGAMYGVTLVVSDTEPGTVLSPAADADDATPSSAAIPETAPSSATAPETAPSSAALPETAPSPAAAPETPTPRRKRPSRARGRAARAGRKTEDRVDNAQIRSWARENGYTLSDRGRVPAVIVAAYREAQASDRADLTA